MNEPKTNKQNKGQIWKKINRNRLNKLQKNTEEEKPKQTDTNRNLPKTGNGKLSNLKLFNSNINIVSKTLILGPHDNVLCAPE